MSCIRLVTGLYIAPATEKAASMADGGQWRQCHPTYKAFEEWWRLRFARFPTTCKSAHTVLGPLRVPIVLVRPRQCVN